MLAKTKVSSDFSLETLARRTDGLSGSDLRETCRNAAMVPVREVMRSKGAKGKEGLELALKEVGFS
jgi:SpoVK/Ycf46/Vps4 family AAA+-type ATPase